MTIARAIGQDCGGAVRRRGLHFGVLLAGVGAVDLATPRFAAVAPDVPVTKIDRTPLATQPRGLDFGAA